VAVRTLLTGRPSCRVVLRTGRAPAETEPGVLEPGEHDLHLAKLRTASSLNFVMALVVFLIVWVRVG
jgi:hypothetical protein